MVDVYSIKPGTVFAWFMLVLVVRRFVLVVMLIVTFRQNPPKPGARAPEDAPRKVEHQNNSTAAVQPPNDFDRAARINAAIRNDSENDAYFLILYLGTAIFSYSLNPDVVRMIVYGAIYLAARITHSFMYLLALQPFRSMSYMVGLLCTFAMSLDLVITTSRSSN